MTPDDLGYYPELINIQKENGWEGFSLGRIIAEHKERYIVKTPEQELEAEVIGNLRFTAQSRADFPAVGDWVAFSPFDDDKAIIHGILPRYSLIERQAVGKKGEKQIIATNIDYAFIVQSANRDFNINRFERYITICHSGGVKPILVLSKIDLISSEELSLLLQNLKERINNLPIIEISNETKEGIDQIKELMESGKTYCLLGSSGVGKSSLLNSLTGNDQIKTGEISQQIQRGKHVTTHRELHLLPEGGIIIDNPGMREVGTADAHDGLESTFDHIIELAQDCKFKDCSHTSEVGCAVLEAVKNDIIDSSTYENYLKMTREQEHYESSVAERRRKDKAFGKMVKNVMKQKKRF